MKNILLPVLSFLLAPVFAGAQAVSINTDGSNPDPSAILDVKSSDKGVLVPQMTTAQRTAIAAPATGLLVFDTTTGGFWFFNGTAWTNLGSGGGTPTTFIADTDGNTTALGYSANIASGDLTNATAIGAHAFAGASNSLVLGSIAGINGATSDGAAGDDFGGSVAISGDYVVVGAEFHYNPLPEQGKVYFFAK